jgi:hypothetical protein
MKICFIPPKGLEARMGGGDAVLSLAPQILENDAYARQVAALGRMGKYVTMDNGMAEGVKLTYEEIRTAQIAVAAKEVVLPDVLGDMGGTLEAVKAYLRLRIKNMGPDEIDTTRYMATVQGTTLAEVYNIIGYYSYMPDVTTLGIPRLLLKELGNKSARIDLANYIKTKYKEHFQLHLLGTSPLWLSEVKYAAKYAPHIRSVDTSMPYNYAMAHQRLDTTTKAISRPHGYFESSHKSLSPNIIACMAYNEEVLLNWAHNGTPSQTASTAP